MNWVYYVTGLGRDDKVLTVGIGLSPNPEQEVAHMSNFMPYRLKLAGMERGDLELLEQTKRTFRRDHMNNMWFRPSEPLLAHLETLILERPAPIRRVSLDLTPEEFDALENLVKQMGVVTKARLLRKAFKFYEALHKYKARGFIIQAIKGGSLVQFPDLDDIR